MEAYVQQFRESTLLQVIHRSGYSNPPVTNSLHNCSTFLLNYRIATSINHTMSNCNANQPYNVELQRQSTIQCRIATSINHTMLNCNVNQPYNAIATFNHMSNCNVNPIQLSNCNVNQPYNVELQRQSTIQLSNCNVNQPYNVELQRQSTMLFCRFIYLIL